MKKRILELIRSTSLNINSEDIIFELTDPNSREYKEDVTYVKHCIKELLKEKIVEIRIEGIDETYLRIVNNKN